MAAIDPHSPTHGIAAAGLRATIARKGAEIVQLGDHRGREVLWQGVEPWPRHAPNLFPIVGMLTGDTLRHAGRQYRMTQHGFARDHDFTWLEATATTARLELRDSAATRAIFPFAFRFEVAYAIDGNELAVTFAAENAGEVVLPCSFGAHPAFRWPLVPGIPKTEHVLEFDADETAPIRRGRNGGIMAERFASPVKDRRLALSDELFAVSAIVMDAPASQSVRYSAPGAPAVTVSWDSGFPNLGIWSRPDAALLCIEPWHGMASPEGWDEEFIGKPGLMHIPSGETRRAVHRIRVA
jgi:galactose mutarotase-like enzyme